MEQRKEDFVQRWHSTYFFIPLFEKPVQMPSLDTFMSLINKKLGAAQPLAEDPKMPDKSTDLLGIMLMDHQAFYKKEDAYYPSQIVLFGPDEFDKDLWDEQMIAQFWSCGPGKEELITKCRYSIMCSNMLAAMLPMVEQYQIMADYAELILELFPECVGIYWPHSQNLVPREYFLEPHWNSNELHFLDGGLNIRFFNINDTNEMLFDTLGFTAIGLPDLQCHCKELEPNDVVQFIRNLAAYMFQNGDVIEDGNTVEGIDHDKWKCQREDSLVGPNRVVLDICPGKYAGGGR